MDRAQRIHDAVVIVVLIILAAAPAFMVALLPVIAPH